MTMSDPIADFLTRIRNANLVRHETVEAPASKMKVSIADILKNQGFIRNYQFTNSNNKQRFISLNLKYGPNRERIITGIKRISKPGLRAYVKSDAVPKVLSGLGIAILSTSDGVMTDKEARDKKIGGEVIAYIW